MKRIKSTQPWLGAGLITALGASLCCISPLVALISGIAGAACYFSWVEPFRPFLIAITVGVLGFSWYRKIKAATDKVNCVCANTAKPSFFQSGAYLMIMTLCTLGMLLFPYYAKAFYPKQDVPGPIANNVSVKRIKFKLRGMDCATCNEHISYSVRKLPGIIQATADFKTGSTTIDYDQRKVSKASIIQAINETGYRITNELAIR